ncbi:unnamed protein product [Rotaria sordida]|uniref:SWIM-type domain-containing protein n=1 Tax=Rotaria sordida TaxID=392033 RepID=A0A815LKN2_9BILA|nr:unnamed protein product [Rotaria sordida]CAF1405513.1 unnamed protein product [Rotaria sordida]CAF4068099.1 unnamed protein product [Rotaria sordida]CAF4126599.1 unnamed protein product [Rotaria sordida]
MLSKWSADAELNDFRQYFEQEWILSLPYWYKEAACLAPSTNNGLESLNARLISCLRLLPPLFCTCRTGLKEYTCVHVLGLLMLWGSQPMLQLIGKRKEKGRPRKVKLALSKD